MWIIRARSNTSCPHGEKLINQVINRHIHISTAPTIITIILKDLNTIYIAIELKHFGGYKNEIPDST